MPCQLHCATEWSPKKLYICPHQRSTCRIHPLERLRNSDLSDRHRECGLWEGPVPEAGSDLSFTTSCLSQEAGASCLTYQAAVSSAAKWVSWYPAQSIVVRTEYNHGCECTLSDTDTAAAIAASSHVWEPPWSMLRELFFLFFFFMLREFLTPLGNPWRKRRYLKKQESSLERRNLSCSWISCLLLFPWTLLYSLKSIHQEIYLKISQSHRPIPSFIHCLVWITSEACLSTPTQLRSASWKECQCLLAVEDED